MQKLPKKKNTTLTASDPIRTSANIAAKSSLWKKRKNTEGVVKCKVIFLKFLKVIDF